jgi:hypothetical protein
MVALCPRRDYGATSDSVRLYLLVSGIELLLHLLKDGFRTNSSI